VSGEYSVWLLPDSSGPASQQLETRISEYARAYKDAPEFAPHITVVGSVPGDEQTLADRVQSLAAEQGPFEVSFATVQCSTTEHQCVFLLVTPTRELLSLQQRAVALFEASNEMYVPHLSLVYSDMSIEQRFELMESLDTSSLPDTATVTTMALVDTSGPVADWEPVRTVHL